MELKEVEKIECKEIDLGNSVITLERNFLMKREILVFHICLWKLARWHMRRRMPVSLHGQADTVASYFRKKI